jgi:hypothetical protein
VRYKSLIMLVLLGVLVFIYNIGAGIYGINGLEPLATFELLYDAAFLCGVVWWLQAEAGGSAVQRTYCSGLLVALGWFIIIPYHLLKTRGARGLIPLLALIGIFIVAQIVTIVAYITLQPTN